jgi:tRNA pseudouridine32 synthase / 23S rRNA pseudouridine746 synthase
MLPAFTVLEQHADFVVLNKTAGVSFHSDDGAGLVVLAAQQLGYALYPVHRLDKVTSGLIILARSSEAASALTALFTAHKVEKYYLALSAAKPAKKQGWIKGDMAPARRGAWKLLSSQHKPAVTYFVSQGFADWPFRAFLLKPFSGKTHQIRVALKSIGAAILGDALYQGANSDRVYLHAYALRFQLADTVFQYVLPPQQGMCYQQLLQTDVLQRWARPWQLDWPEYKLPLQIIE